MPDESKRIGDPQLADRLTRELEGEVLFDRFSRGRYSSDASIYQIEPIGVAVPRTADDLVRAVEIARDEKIPIVPRGAGTSQGGQSIGQALVIDTSKYLNRVIDFDPESRRVTVEPGIVLDHLNAFLKPHGLFFPVDVATASQATLGGMAGNNSAGSRSIRYGLMVDNVRAIDAVLADGRQLSFGEALVNLTDQTPDGNGAAVAVGAGDLARYREIVETVQSIHGREASQIAERFPAVLRRVAGYNLDRIGPVPANVASLLVGSEGTLAVFARLQLDLQRLPAHSVLGVCHFPTFQAASDSVRHIVELGPTAVELVDRTLIELARQNPAFNQAVGRFVHGEPDALLLVEFAGDELNPLLEQLARLDDLMESLGFSRGTVSVIDPAFQSDIWAVRKAGLNIVMSMKGDGKPVSFIEDCAVPLEHLTEYTSRLSEVFARHGTHGTWYAHASVGCLHIRPVLNLKLESDVRKMRTIAEEAHALVREFKGCHSGEHGDGLVRSEFLEPMLGERIVRAFEEIKDCFDPEGMLNPGKIVRPPRMDDRSLLRYKPGYAPLDSETALDWSDWGCFTSAVEMCNNNGACRKADPDVMCPSYRVTRDEQHVTRGRANTLRLALTGQLGPDALTSDAMWQTMDLCISCKACRRECPTGVDMARMKIEFLHRFRTHHGITLKDRLVAYLPRYAPLASRVPLLMNARNHSSLLARLGERIVGLSARRQLPMWQRDVFRRVDRSSGEQAVSGTRNPRARTDRAVVLLVDTFNTYFEPENARAAVRVLTAAGYRVILPQPADGGRPLCCGRTFLNAGLVEQAKVEGHRVLEALAPYVGRGIPVLGLEPSCLLTLRDEYTVMFSAGEVSGLVDRAMLLEEFLAAEEAAGMLDLPLQRPSAERVVVHGHCHQKAFGAMDAMERTLKLIPELKVEFIESSCCGMAGSFGYDASHYDVSMRMAELNLLPAVRETREDDWLVANGTSCRRQILDGAGRNAMHAIRVLEAALAVT